MPIAPLLIWGIAAAALFLKGDHEQEKLVEKDVCKDPPYAPSFKIPDLGKTYWFQSPKSKADQFCRNLSNSLIHATLGTTTSPDQCTETSKSSQTYTEIGNQWFKRNQPAMGILAYCKAIEVNPSADRYKQLGKILLDHNDLDLFNAQIASFEAVQSIDPKNGSAYLGLGFAYLERAKNKIKIFKDEVSQEKISGNAIEIKYEEVLSDLNAARHWTSQSHDERGIGNKNLGRIYSMWGDFNLFRKSKLKSEDKRANDFLIVALENYRKAEEFYTAAIDQYPQDSEKKMNTIWSLIDVKKKVINIEEKKLDPNVKKTKWEEVFKLYSQMVDRSTSFYHQNPTVTYEFAESLEKAGEFQKAFERYQIVANLDCEEKSDAKLGAVDLLFKLGKQAEDAGDKARAKEIYTEVVRYFAEDNPNKAHALYVLGWMTVRENEKKSFENGVKFYNFSSDMYSRLIAAEKDSDESKNLRQSKSNVLIDLAKDYTRRADPIYQRFIKDPDSVGDDELSQALLYARNALQSFYGAKNPSEPVKSAKNDSRESDLNFPDDLEDRIDKLQKMVTSLNEGSEGIFSE